MNVGLNTTKERAKEQKPLTDLHNVNNINTNTFVQMIQLFKYSVPG